MKTTQTKSKRSKSFLGKFADGVKKMISSTGPDLQDLFYAELKDIYWAEKELAANLPKLAEKTTTAQLKKAITEHATETLIHVERLKEVFALIGEVPASKKCAVMEGLLTETDEIVSETKEGTVLRDVGIILAAQKVEHYEIATYGTLKTLADVLGHQDASILLNLTLQEEKNADATLNDIAVKSVNLKAQKESLKS